MRGLIYLLLLIAFMLASFNAIVQPGTEAGLKKLIEAAEALVAGVVDIKKFQYDVWGDTVNTASRMESHGEAGKVNISQRTYEQIRDQPQLHFTPRGKIDVKGKGEVEMWFVFKNKTI